MKVVNTKTPALTYDDVILLPQYSDIHRRDVDLSVKIGSKTFSAPVISSPMNTVTEVAMAYEMMRQGSMALLHRYCTIDEQLKMYAEIPVEYNNKRKSDYVGAAIGNSKDYLERAKAFDRVGCQILCIDVAHADSERTYDAIRKIRKFFNGVLIVGNIATGAAADRMSLMDINAVRVGVGGGSACKTRTTTGHGLPNLTSIVDCKDALLANHRDDIAIIADGGIRLPGDAVKAYAAGAHMVMMGYLFAGTSESSGKLLSIEGKKYKTYMGMASASALNTRPEGKQNAGSVEGVEKIIPFTGPTTDFLNDFLAGVKQGLFYSGARTLKDLQKKAEFAIVTPSGVAEGRPHGKTIL